MALSCSNSASSGERNEGREKGGDENGKDGIAYLYLKLEYHAQNGISHQPFLG